MASWRARLSWPDVQLAITARRRLRPLAMVIALMLTACAGTPGSVEGSPAPSATASVSSTASAAGTPAGDPVLFQNMALAAVNVDDLVVRSEPSTSAPQLADDAGSLSLDEGDRVLVLGGPVAADGSWWFMVGVERDPEWVVPVGWIPTGTQDDPWITEDNSFCPDEVDFAALVTLSGIARVGCYASAPISFQAYQATIEPGAGLGGACDSSVPAGFLRCDNINYNWVNEAGGTAWEFLLHFDPARGIPETELADAGTAADHYAITGHFDDPAAQDCITAADPASAQAQSEWLTCAAMFVVEALTTLD